LYLLSKKEMQLNKIVNTETAKTLGILGLSGIVVFGGYKALQFFNLIPDQDDKDADKFDALLQKWQSPEFLGRVGKDYLSRGGQKSKLPYAVSTYKTNSKYSELATRLKEAKGLLNDNEDAVTSVFREMRSGIDYAFTNSQFWRANDKNSIVDFLSFLDSKEKAKIYAIVKKYPDYIFKK
jgi:hypothetical protein